MLNRITSATSNKLSPTGGMMVKVSEVLQANLSMYESSINYIATKSGVSQSSLSRFHAEKYNLSMDSIEKLCDFFGLRLVEEVNPTTSFD
jgi:predicted transcriptional regulator